LQQVLRNCCGRYLETGTKNLLQQYLKSIAVGSLKLLQVLKSVAAGTWKLLQVLRSCCSRYLETVAEGT